MIFVFEKMKRSFISILLFFIAPCITAQSPGQWEDIEAMPNSEQKVDSALAWLKKYKLPEWDTTWYPMAERIADWAKALNSDLHMARLEDWRFFYFNYHQKKEKSRIHAFAGLHFAKKTGLQIELARAFRNLGTYYLHRGQMDSSLHCFVRTGEIFEALGRKEELWRSTLPRAEIQAGIKNMDLADQLFAEAWESVQLTKSRFHIGYVLWTITSHYARAQNNKKFDRFLGEWEKFQAERSGSMSNENQKLHANLLSFFSEDFKSAEKQILSGLEYHTAQNNDIRAAIFSLSLGELYFKHVQFRDAVDWLHKADGFLTHSGRSNPAMKTDILKTIYESQKALGNYAEALNSLEIYYHFQDSLSARGSAEQLQELEKQYEAEKLKNQLEQEKTALKNAKTQKNLLLISLIAVLCGGALAFYFFRKLSISREEVALKEHALQEKIIEDLTKQRQVTSLHAMIEGQEKERLRIARDLHDGLGSFLTSIKVNFNELGNHIPLNGQQQQWEKVNHIIDQACVEVRKISHNMMPHALSLAGIEGAVDDLKELLVKNGIDAELEIIGDFSEMEEERSIMLYRILQELVSNIVRHSGATTALVQLIQHSNEISLIAEDNGCGFNKESDLGDGIGLRNLKARIDFLGGMLDVDSQQGQGTTVTIRIPTNQNFKSVEND